MTAKRPVALVTGAGRRVGRAIALDLAAHGWNVAVHYNGSAAQARSAVKAIERSGGKGIALQADLGDETAVRTLLPQATKALGPVSCLVNSAAVFEDDRVRTASRESWDFHMETNLRAPFVLSQSFAKLLPRRLSGNIVNILDQRVRNLTPYFISYTVSKMGLWTLTRSMALALAPRIRVNAIGPGPVLPSTHQSEAQFRRQWSLLPLARSTPPDEIARGVRFILEAPSLTGQMIALDGGQHLGWGHVPAGKGTDE